MNHEMFLLSTPMLILPTRNDTLTILKGYIACHLCFGYIGGNMSNASESVSQFREWQAVRFQRARREIRPAMFERYRLDSVKRQLDQDRFVPTIAPSTGGRSCLAQ